VLKLLRERFHAWQEQGHLPSRRIEPGDETTRLTRERGWTHWHHLFHPRQSLVQELLAKESSGQADMVSAVACLLGLGKCLDTGGSKLCVWNLGYEKVSNTFLNQSFNTLINYGLRPLLTLSTSWYVNTPASNRHAISSNVSTDARKISELREIWITDPLCRRSKLSRTLGVFPRLVRKAATELISRMVCRQQTRSCYHGI